MSLRPTWQIFLIALAYPIANLFFSGGLSTIQAWSVAATVFLVYFAILACPGSSQFATTLVEGREEYPGEPSRGNARLWFWLGLFYVAAALTFLEIRQPFYFSQDDGTGQFLPGILQAVHSLDLGIFPTWNPYQYMGSPSTTVGTYALTYPPTYASYWISKHLLRNEYCTIDVFAIFHLLAGYAAVFWSIRREQVRPSLAMLGGWCCVLSGFALVVGRSWFYMTPVFVWTPLLLGLIRSAIERPPNWKWICAFGLVTGLYFHAGNVQMWAYTMLLLVFTLALLAVARIMQVRRMLAISAGAVLGIALAAPLLLPELSAIQGVTRVMFQGGMAKGLPTLFVPVSIIHTMHPMQWGGASKYVVGEMYYSGTLFCVAGVFLLLVLLGFRWDRRTVKNNVWFPGALLALVLALGPAGILWNILWKTPGFDKFRTAFKFLGLFDIFIALAGAVVIERLLRRWRWRLRGEIAIVLLVALVLGYHCTLSTGSFYIYGFPPFPAVDPNIRHLLEPKNNTDYPKLVSLSTWRSDSPDWLNSMYLQWPTLFGFFSFGGYDPLVEFTPQYHNMFFLTLTRKEEAFRHFGVRYFVVDRSLPELWDPEHGASRIIPGSDPSNPQLRPVYHSAQVTVFELPEPEPMAFEESTPAQPLPVTFDGAGATIHTSGVPGQTIILNMLRRPEIHARSGEHEILVDNDSWYRIRIHLNTAAQQVRVEFSPGWGRGFAGGLAGLLISMILGVVYIRLQGGGEKRPVSHRPSPVVLDSDEDGCGEKIEVGAHAGSTSFP